MGRSQRTRSSGNVRVYAEKRENKNQGVLTGTPTGIYLSLYINKHMFRAFAQGRITYRTCRHGLSVSRINATRLGSLQAPLPGTRIRNWTLLVPGGLFVGITSLYLFLPDTSRSAPTFSTKPLSARHFTCATVISNEDSGPNSKILKLKVSPHLIPKDGEDPIGFEPIWSVYIKDDDIQVERPYTPLESIDEEGNIVFWIKKYPKGEVGRWLHSKRPGDIIELRGPLKTLNWIDGEWNEIVLVGFSLSRSLVLMFPTKIPRFQVVQESPHFTSLSVGCLNTRQLAHKTLDFPWYIVHEPLKSYRQNKSSGPWSLMPTNIPTDSSSACL